MNDSTKYSEKVRAHLDPSRNGRFCFYPGWSNLVNQLHDELITKYPDYKIYNIKDKFGGIRISVGGIEDEGQDVVMKYENLSCKICETCGAPATRRTIKNWIFVRCDDHVPEF